MKHHEEKKKPREYDAYKIYIRGKISPLWSMNLWIKRTLLSPHAGDINFQQAN